MVSKLVKLLTPFVFAWGISCERPPADVSEIGLDVRAVNWDDDEYYDGIDFTIYCYDERGNRIKVSDKKVQVGLFLFCWRHYGSTARSRRYDFVFEREGDVYKMRIPLEKLGYREKDFHGDYKAKAIVTFSNGRKREMFSDTYYAP